MARTIKDKRIREYANYGKTHNALAQEVNWTPRHIPEWFEREINNNPTIWERIKLFFGVK